MISVMPMANQGIYRSVRAYSGRRPIPFLAVMTDFQEEMRGVWFPREKDYYIACGSERAYRQALSKPHPRELTFRISGAPVHPSFYDQPPLDPVHERVKLGLHPDRPTGCMMYGSAGSPRMALLAQALRGVERKCQMIFLCGRNQKLADVLVRSNLPYPHLIRTYTTEIPYFFALSDFLVCKPGPGTISEAQASGLPLLVDRRNVLPQERYNLTWLREKHLGLSFESVQEFKQGVEDLLAGNACPGRGPRRTGAPENRAIFELSAVIQDILSR